MPPRPRCLIAFDAFGTLFSPRASIARQYVDVTNAFLVKEYPNLKPLSVDPTELQNTYMNAFRKHRQTYPNYGKESGMGPEAWWRKLIKATLDPFLRNQISENDWERLSQRLWTQFSSDKGYSMHEDSYNLLEHLKSYNKQDIQYIVGVVSNSDPRVQMVLQSMDINVSPVTAAKNANNSAISQDNHIHFIVTSYDAGFAKPSKEIFDIAENTARLLLPSEEQNQPLLKIYLGDEYEKDGLPAIRAGWNSVLVDRNTDDELSNHFPYLDVLTYPDEANPQSGKPLFLERVKSLWPFNPHVLSNVEALSSRTTSLNK